MHISRTGPHALISAVRAPVLPARKCNSPCSPTSSPGASESDGLVVGSDLDLAAQNQPTGAYPVAAAANHFIRQVLGNGPELGARDRAADQRRIRAMLLEESIELPVNVLGTAHISAPKWRIKLKSCDLLSRYVKYRYSELIKLLAGSQGESMLLLRTHVPKGSARG